MLQISRRPLAASEADARLFVDRSTETRAVRRALQLGFSVLVLGDPKSGRTSFLHHLERSLIGSSCVFVDIQRYDTSLEKILAIRAALGEDIRNLPRYERAMDSDIADMAGLRKIDVTPVVHESHIAGMASASKERRVVLLDNADPDFTHLVFGRFRDVLWQFPHQWIVAGHLGQRMLYLEPPADSFFDAIVELEVLSKDEAAELLHKRVEAGGDSAESRALRGVIPAIVDSVPELTPGGLLAAARFALLSDRSPRASLRDIGAMQQRAAALGRNAAMLFSEVEALGPVHAGDERLLRRLGYTRPRVVQLLKELEDAGLVIAKSEGKRRMYEVAKPHEFEAATR